MPNNIEKMLTDDQRQFLIIVLRIFFPGHRTWIVKTLILSGLAIVVRPFWEPLIEAYLKDKFGVSVPNIDPAGWVLLALGIILYLVNIWFERNQPKLNSSSSVEEIENAIISSDSQTDWIHNSKGLKSTAVYKKDSNLRFEVSIADEDLQNRRFQEPWANKHPDPNSTGYYYDLYYGSTLIKRYILVGVDGERALLPLPDRTTLQVDEMSYKVAQIHDTTGTLDEYMQRSGLTRC